MELETVRAVADFLADPTAGVVAQLATVPRDAGDPLPTLPGGVADSTRNGWVARREIPHENGPVLPAIAVYAQPITLDGDVHTVVRDGVLDIVMAYCDQNSDTPSGNAAALYVRRAILKCLAVFESNAHAADRQRNDIAIFACERLKLGPLEAAWADINIRDAVVATFHVRDLAP